MRPSGTLQAPTTGSLEAMLRETVREEQIAAARKLPKQVNIQLPDAPVVTYEPAKTAALVDDSTIAANKTEAANSAPAGNTTAKATTALTPQVPPALKPVENRTDVALQNDGAPSPKPAALTTVQTAAEQKTDVATALKKVVSSPTDVSTTSLAAKQDTALTEVPAAKSDAAM